MCERIYHTPALAQTRMAIRYAESDPRLPENLYDLHVHPECEVCVHLAGDLTFVAEDSLYPVMPGDVTITRPYEYHHCVYHSDAPHKHYWLLFTPEGNEPLLERFLQRTPGQGNRLTLPGAEAQQLAELCRAMVFEPDDPLTESLRFLRLIQLLNLAQSQSSPATLYPDVQYALSYIAGHLAERISVAEIAQTASVSVNTLERHFREALALTPLQYLRRKRLARACELLSGSLNVTEVSQQCGFNDCSAFIAQFRQTYGVTPLQYKHQLPSRSTEP